MAKVAANNIARVNDMCKRVGAKEWGMQQCNWMLLTPSQLISGFVLVLWCVTLFNCYRIYQELDGSASENDAIFYNYYHQTDIYRLQEMRVITTKKTKKDKSEGLRFYWIRTAITRWCLETQLQEHSLLVNWQNITNVFFFLGPSTIQNGLISLYLCFLQWNSMCMQAVYCIRMNK